MGTNRLLDAAGCLTMVALDHRESLRTMLDAPGRPASDEDVRSFKRTAIRELGGAASAVLLDRATALDAPLPDGTALVLAADVFDQPPGSPVLASRLDGTIDVATIRACGAAAIKLLVLWQPDRGERERACDVSRFVALARAAGVAALVEGIVPAGADRDAWVREAAAELCAFGPDVYKAQIPGYTPGDVSRVRAESERLTAVVGRPWVVLSNGVRTQDFTAGMREACAGGATGFLAGRAVWSDVAASADPAGALRSVSLPRLLRMIDVAHQAVSVAPPR